MRRSGGRRLAPHDVEEDERVVYYDLEAGAHSRNLLVSPDAAFSHAQPRAATTKAPAGEGSSHIFPRKQQTLFHLDDSGDEAKDEENPFATLLQLQQTQQTTEPVAERDEGATQRPTETCSESSFLSVPEARQRSTGLAITNGRNHRSILKNSQHRSTGVTRVHAGGKKKLGFEAAGSRPERWNTRKTSATDTKNRRKSLGAIQKRRSQLEASAAKRRKSMPPISLGSQVTRNPSSADDSMNFAVPKGRLLLDVLQQATLSQQQNESSVSPTYRENLIESDAILDTEHQMRAEPFAPQIFSPSKPSPPSDAIRRIPRDDAIVSKVRGKVGDLIRKAIRKRNRDLTLLRSHGQHLLPQQGSHSSPKGIVGAVESIQDRAYVVVCLQRRHQVTPHSVSYDCRIQEVAAKLESSIPTVLRGKHSEGLEAIFQPKTVEYLKLSSGLMLKIYEPLHFVSEKVAAGSASKPRWFLLSTQLTEVVQGNHCG